MRDTWDEVHDQVVEKPRYHFLRTLGIQLEEVEDDLDRGDLPHAAKEMVDIISVTLNWMRWLGLSAEDIAKVIKTRTETRYLGQAQDILDKYWKEYAI